MKLISSSFSLPSSLKYTKSTHIKKQSKSISVYSNPRRSSILVVEDDEEISSIFTMLQFENNWPIKIVKNSMDAISILSKNSFDYLILDWNLPDMNADELILLSSNLYSIKNRYNSIQIENKTPIVTFSSNKLNQYSIRESNYFYHYKHWQKPFTFEKLKYSLKNLIYTT